MMLFSAVTAGGGVGNFGSDGSGAGCAKAGTMAASASSDNAVIFFMSRPCFSFLFRKVAPQPFQRRRQGLHDDTAIDMAGTQREDIAIVIALLLQHRRH